MLQEEIFTIVLAAGEGKRMNARKHKVLHALCARTVIEHVLAQAGVLATQKPIVVVGYQHEQLENALAGRVDFALQDPENGWGTAKAVEAALPYFQDKQGIVLVAMGDMPLIRKESYQALVTAVRNGAPAAMLTAKPKDMAHYGRIVRDEAGRIVRNVEFKDLQADQMGIDEMNTGIYCFTIPALVEVLSRIDNHNASNEYYFTDAIELLTSRGYQVEAIELEDADEALGINTQKQLAEAAKTLQRRINDAHMEAGVTIIDPDSTFIGSDVTIEPDSVIHPFCTLQGNTHLCSGVTLMPHCRLDHCQIGSGTTIEQSVLIHATVGENATVGPFAYLRPGTVVGDHCRIGDFVEIKNSTIGDGTKVSHLAYVGDGDLGQDINVSCGVIFSNYDGKSKFRTTVEDKAFIGCNVNLVSPVHVGKEAYIAAGSTITKNVPDGALAIGRARQETKEGWVKARKEAGKL